jgi:meso-butanediol dehydrogenase / (S,S)-butanediol dehydrogenase / diacetyl reductase
MAGKVIVITGANGGLGRALALRFANEGEKVVLLGRSLEKVQEVATAIGANAMAVACEVTSPDSVRAAFVEIAKMHPTIDVLINNAAIFDPFLIEEARDDQILGGILNNLAGPMLCTRSAVPMMGQGGLIINVSSESVDLPFPHLLVYQSTKAGLEQFSKGLHRELEGKGIRVSTVRAGQMTGAGQSAVMDPETGMRFFQACIARGFNPMDRGTTQYESTTGLFRLLIDLPADMHLDIATFQARKPA